MVNRRPTSFRSAITALLVLCAALAGAEYWCRCHEACSVVVSSRTAFEYQTLLTPSETCHHELRPGLTEVIPGPGDVSVRVRINGDGCRGPESSVDDESEGFGADAYRILVLGDDTVFGGHVDEASTLPARIEKFLRRNTKRPIQVINGGVPGYCPLLSWLQFENSLKSLKPDLVILHVDMTDPDDDAAYRSGLLRSVSDSESKGESPLQCRHASLRMPARRQPAVVEKMNQSALARWLFTQVRSDQLETLPVQSDAMGQYRFRWISDYPPDLRLEVDHALRPIATLRDAVEQTGARFLVSTCPVVWQVTDGKSVPNLTRKCRVTGTLPMESRFPFDVLTSFCDRQKIRFLDTSPEFAGRKNVEKLFSVEQPTLSALGLAFYGKLICDYLSENPETEWDRSETLTDRHMQDGRQNR